VKTLTQIEIDSHHPSSSQLFIYQFIWSVYFYISALIDRFT